MKTKHVCHWSALLFSCTEPLNSQILSDKLSPHESTKLSSTAGIFPGLQTPWPTISKTKDEWSLGPSTWPSCFSSSRHTSGLIGDMCQTGQAASKFGQPTIGEQLVYGSGFSHSSCGDHRHRPEQSTAAGTGRAQDWTLGLTTNRLRMEKTTNK